MEVLLLEKTSLRIKSKHANFVVDPIDKIQKTSADAVIILSENYDTSKITDFRVVVKSAGEYEVGGVKISGIALSDSIVYYLSPENISVFLAKASSLEKISADKIGECQVAVINVDFALNQSVVTAMEPKTVILYGEKAEEAAKLLGKGDVESSQKYIIAQDKFPEEMQVILLK